MKIEGYSDYISFILLVSKKKKVKLFGITIWNMYLCAHFSMMKSVTHIKEMKFTNLFIASIRHIQVVFIGDNSIFTSAAAEAFHIGQHTDQT